MKYDPSKGLKNRHQGKIKGVGEKRGKDIADEDVMPVPEDVETENKNSRVKAMLKALKYLKSK